MKSGSSERPSKYRCKEKPWPFFAATHRRFWNACGTPQPNGQVHYHFWQRDGGYDRNIQEPATLRKMIDYVHNNPVRRGLVDQPTDWPWSSAWFYAGEKDVTLVMDPLVEFVGLR